MKQSLPESVRLDGLRIVLDCANGAAYNSAPTVFWELGADVVAIGITPNGININDKCGSTAPALLQETVVASGADIGICLLYTSDAADERSSVDLGGRRILNKKKEEYTECIGATSN